MQKIQNIFLQKLQAMTPSREAFYMVNPAHGRFAPSVPG
jgi:hypothetical protein